MLKAGTARLILPPLNEIEIPANHPWDTTFQRAMYRAEILLGNYKYDHFPVCLELQMLATAAPLQVGNLDFFRLNLSVALSECGKAGIRDILQHWMAASGSALQRLEKALVECQFS